MVALAGDVASCRREAAEAVVQSFAAVFNVVLYSSITHVLYSQLHQAEHRVIGWLAYSAVDIAYTVFKLSLSIN
jgi:hypothetical protein